MRRVFSLNYEIEKADNRIDAADYWNCCHMSAKQKRAVIKILAKSLHAYHKPSLFFFYFRKKTFY